ncbi:MAG TPA: tetratricopeptide repeat protein [Candidatus Saccharimonadales bacterium]|nr:tetratricopeptide repeat protein [Candidatus Saccharimonadales bacterium]
MKPSDIVESEYARLFRDKPDSPDFWRLRARKALQYQQKDAAIAALKTGIRHFPEDLTLIGDLANIYLLMRDVASARPLLEGLLRVGERRVEYVSDYARLLWLEGAYPQALEHYEEAYTRNPDERKYALRLAQARASLGQVQQALSLLRSWLHKKPSAEMMALLALCEFDVQGVESALNLITDGKQREPSNPTVNYLYAVLLTLSGDSERAKISMTQAGQSDQPDAQWASFLYARGSRDISFYGLNSTLLISALALAPVTGLVAEFGVYHGLSLNQIAQQVAGPVHGFDSFEGLPEDWKASEPAGSYSTHGRLPQVPPYVVLHPGWFADTLPAFVAQQTEKARFIHIDCDLYSSTRTVLEGLYPLLQAGTVLVFDEYLGFPGYEQHEFRAWREFSRQRQIEYQYFGCTLMAKAVALRVTDMGRV